MSDEILAYRMAQMEKKIEELETDVERLEEGEKQKLKWGISLLGGALVTVVGIVWSYRAIIFKG